MATYGITIKIDDLLMRMNSWDNEVFDVVRPCEIYCRILLSYRVECCLVLCVCFYLNYSLWEGGRMSEYFWTVAAGHVPPSFSFHPYYSLFGACRLYTLSAWFAKVNHCWPSNCRIPHISPFLPSYLHINEHPKATVLGLTFIYSKILNTLAINWIAVKVRGVVACLTGGGVIGLDAATLTT